MANDIILKVENLSVSYPGQGLRREKAAVRNLSLEIEKGEIIGLLGPNGAGKTTFIKALVGLINIKNGAVSFFGGARLSKNIKNRIGYTPEIANYYWFLTPKEVLGMFGKICGMGKKILQDRTEYTLKTVGLIEQKDQLIKNLSKGMQNRLNIAQALLHDPEFLILDEPFSGLDPLGRIHVRNILKALKEKKKTILLSSHELSEAELICDRVCIMKKGSVLKYDLLEKLLEGRGEYGLERYFINIIGEEDGDE